MATVRFQSSQSLSEALGSRDDVYLSDTLRNGAYSMNAVQQAIVKAVELDWPEGMQTLYKHARNTLHYREWQRAFDLYHALGRRKSLACWQVAWEENQRLPREGVMPTPAIFKAFAETGFLDGIKDLLETKISPSFSNVYAEIVTDTADSHEDLLATVASYADRFEGGRHTLNAVLDEAVRRGRLGAVLALMDVGATVEGQSGQRLFQLAVDEGSGPLLQAMEKQGLPVAAYAQDLLSRPGAMSRISDETLFHLDKFRGGTLSRVVSSPDELYSLRQRYCIVDGDTLQEKKRLSMGSLTMLFNFATRQQVMIGAVAQSTGSAMTVVKFSDIENQQAVQRAADIFVALGGDPRMVEDAARSLDKKRLPLAPK